MKIDQELGDSYYIYSYNYNKCFENHPFGMSYENKQTGIFEKEKNRFILKTSYVFHKNKK